MLRCLSLALPSERAHACGCIRSRTGCRRQGCPAASSNPFLRMLTLECARTQFVKCFIINAVLAPFCCDVYHRKRFCYPGWRAMPPQSHVRTLCLHLLACNRLCMAYKLRSDGLCNGHKAARMCLRRQSRPASVLQPQGLFSALRVACIRPGFLVRSGRCVAYRHVRLFNCSCPNAEADVAKRINKK